MAVSTTKAAAATQLPSFSCDAAVEAPHRLCVSSGDKPAQYSIS